MLPAVLDGLSEDAVFVTQPIAHRRQLHRRHRVEKASRQAPEPAVSRARRRALASMRPSQSTFFCSAIRFAKGSSRRLVILLVERAPDQKFHRQVVDALRVLAVVGAFCPHPALREDIPHRAGGRLKRSRGPAALGATMLSKSRCRSYKASSVPENRIGPQPYCARRTCPRSDRERSCLASVLFGRFNVVSSISLMATCFSLPKARSGHVSRLDMARFVPLPDCRLDQIVFIAQRAEARGAQQEVSARRRVETEPAGGEHPQEMAARKKQHVAVDGAHPAQDAIGAGADLVRRLASRTAVAEQLPIRALRVDLGRAKPLILAVDPFDKVRSISATAPKPASSQVRAARCNGLVKTLAKTSPRSSAPRARALRSRRSVKGRSVRPVC